MSRTATFATQFTTVFKMASEASTKERTRIDAELVKLSEQKEELEKRIHELEAEHRSIDADISTALQHAARDAGIKVNLKRSHETPVRSNGMRMRRTDMDRITVVLLNSLPNDQQDFVSKSALANKTKLSADQVNAGLIRLRREGRAASNGLRGSQAGWRRGKSQSS